MEKRRLLLSILLLISNICLISAQDTLFFEDFDDTPPDSKPDGWTTEIGPDSRDFQFVNGGGTKSPGTSGTRRPPASHSDTTNALFFFESIGQEYTFLITPAVNLEFALKPELRFQHAQMEGNLGPGLANDELRIYYKIHADSAWVESRKIGEYTDPVQSWTEQTILIPEEAYVSECYFAFKAKTNYAWGVCIDDVSVIETGEQPRHLDTLRIQQAGSDFIPTGTVNNVVLRIDVTVKGNTGNVVLNSIDVSSLNSSDADIPSNGVKLFYNYINKNFYEALPLDMVSFVSGEGAFTGLDFSLPTGNTSLWITCDIETDATHGNLVDAMIQADGIDIDDVTYPEASISPPGSRLIRKAVFYDDFATDNGWILAGDFQRNRPQGIGGNYIGNPDPDYAAWDTLVIGNDLTGLGVHPGDYEDSVPRYENLATSPSFDLTYYNDVKLSFLRWLNVANNDTASVEMSIDDGSSWNEIWANNNQVFTDGSWTFFSQDMTGGNRESQVKLRINLGPTSETGIFSGWNIENFSVTGNYVEYDVGPVALLAPGQGCGHTSAETVQIKVKNFGPGATPDKIPVRYSFDGGDTFISDTISGVIAFGDETTFDFSQTVDLSTPGIYNVVLETALDVDEESTNDTFDTILYVDPAYPVPYFQDFEEEMDYWRVTGSNSSFEYGTPLGGIIHEAASGGRAWVTNLDGDYYNSEDAYLMGPCFDLSGMDYPVFEFQIFTSMEQEDGTNLEYSLDGGQIWSRVGNMGDGDAYGWNWYNSNTIAGLDGNHGWTGDTIIWRTARIMLDTLVFRDISSAKFRFHFVSDEALRIEGLGIDDIRIYDLPRDIGVVSIDSPISECAQDIGDHVSVTIENFGLDTLMTGDTIIVGYDLESDPTVVDTFLLATDLLKGHTVQYTFKRYLNITTSGTKNIEVFTLLPDDVDFYNEVTTNDTSSKSFDVELTPFVFLPSQVYTVRPDTIILNAYTGNPTDWYEWQDASDDSAFQVIAMTDGIYHVIASNALCNYRDTTYVYKLTADVGVTGIIDPADACELGSAVQPSIEVTNFGTDTIHVGDTIPVRYSVDGGTVAEENAILSELIFPDSTFEFTFTTTTDMSAIQTYSVRSFTSLDYDDYAPNDTTVSSAEVFGITQIDLGADTIVRALEWTLDAGTYDTYLWQDGSTTQTFVADTTDWYRVTVKEGTKCENSDSLHLIMVVPDVAFNRISNPANACGLSATENLDLYIFNAGSDTLTSIDTIPIAYRVNGGALREDTLFVDRTVLPGDSIMFSSAETVDLRTPGTYQFKIYTAYGKDLINDNDTLHQNIEVYGYPSVSLGTDTVVNAKTYGLDAGGGFSSYLWQDGSTDRYFTADFENSSVDSMYQVTITDDNGCAAQDQIRVTFSFRDIGAGGILIPVSACTLTNQEELIVLVINYGTLPIIGEQIRIIAKLDNGIPVTGQKTITQSLDPGDTLEFTFGLSFDLSVQGDHDMLVYTEYGRDADVHNDTLSDIISHFGNPGIDLGGVNDTLETALPYTLDAGADYVSYTWNDVAGSRTFDANAYGWYKLEVTDLNSCYGVDSVYLTSSTHVTDLNLLDSRLKVYPNPVDNILYIEFNSPDHPDLIMEIFDGIGRKVMVREYNHVSGIFETVDVSDMPKGIYYLRVRLDSQQVLRKIVIQ